MSLREKDKRERIAKNNERKKEIVNEIVSLRYFLSFISPEKINRCWGEIFFSI